MYRTRTYEYLYVLVHYSTGIIIPYLDLIMYRYGTGRKACILPAGLLLVLLSPV